MAARGAGRAAAAALQACDRVATATRGRGQIMKLSEPQIQKVEVQTGATVIPPDHPSVAELESHFGQHTFFIDDEGLHVWEPQSKGESESDGFVGMRVATWSDENKTALVPHEPMATQVLQESN